MRDVTWEDKVMQEEIFDLPMRYQPHNKVWDMLIRIFMR